ncbi:MAG: hypothetical protein [Arizlama microvirus]|nr:MAG: hypothetical protein [Arizlama microvirus]
MILITITKYIKIVVKIITIAPIIYAGIKDILAVAEREYQEALDVWCRTK